MRSIIIFLCLLINFSLSAQDYYAELEKKMLSLYQEKKYNESLQLSTQYLRVFPDNLTANGNQAACLLFLNRPTEALTYIDRVLLMDPTAGASLTAKAYAFAQQGNVSEAKKLLTEAIRLSLENEDSEVAIEEMKEFGKVFNKQEVFQNLAQWLKQTEPTIREREWSLAKLISLYNQYPENPAELMKQCREKVALFNQQNKPVMALLAFSYAARWLNSWGYKSEALEIATEGYVQLKSKGFGDNHYLASYFIAQLMANHSDKGDQEKAIQFSEDFFEHMGKSPLITIDIDGLTNLSNAYSILRSGDLKKNQAAANQLAIQAYDLALKNQYINGIVVAANSIVLSSYNTDYSAAAIRYGEYGFKVAEENHLSIKKSIISNLALLYWGTGRDGQQKCRNLYRFQIEQAKKENRWSDASLYLNNLGALYYHQNDMEQAIQLFEESALLANEGVIYSNPQDRLSHYQSQMSANQWLVLCYAQTGNTEKAFESMERSRARVLTERLAQKPSAPPTIAEFQNLLKPDEACLMYHVFSAHQLVILTVTKKYAQVFYLSDPRFVGDIRERYFNRSKQEQNTEHTSEESVRGFEWISQDHQRTQVNRGYDRDEIAPRSEFDRVVKLTRKFSEKPDLNDEMLMDLLTRYQRFLITPINNRLGGIKTLIISPNDVLSFIPFEALKTFDGKYLVEKYNIRYLHSASVMQQLAERKYESSRKPLLAMGGAIYEDLATDRKALSTESDLTLLQAEVEENLRNNKSVRKAYATLFGTKAMNALPGTVEEVKNISKNLSGADVFFGKDMTENRIKAMSKSGELANYKVLHLATHGFVVAEIPDLSGVAMSIFTEEQGGEDGFLNAVEISNLKLKCDLTVLSACQTALGKLYVGEGVTGLTQSLLVAGSNAALVSLWPVNDTSTMLFMSNFYKEVAKGKPYPQIVNDLKKKFIKGEFGKEFQHPHFWAPFIYYGN